MKHESDNIFRDIKLATLMPTSEHWVKHQYHASRPNGIEAHCVKDAILCLPLKPNEAILAMNIADTWGRAKGKAGIVDWNDSDTTTFDDVREFIRWFDYILPLAAQTPLFPCG